MPTALLGNGGSSTLAFTDAPDEPPRCRSAATTADQRLVYNQSTGQLFFDADGNGAGAAVLFALVVPGTALTTASFEVIAPPATTA